MPIDSTPRTKGEIFDRMLRTVQSSKPEWTSTSLSTFGNSILDAMAGEVAAAHFAIDVGRRQNSISTATNLDAGLVQANSAGYPVKANSAATAIETIVLSGALGDTLTIAPGDIDFRTDDANPLIFQVSETTVIPAGVTTFQINVENATTITENFVIPESLPDLRFKLASGPYVQDSAIVSVNATPFTTQNTLVLSEPADDHVRIRLGLGSRLLLKFGDNKNGVQPSTGALVVTYKIGGGAVGQVGENTIVVPSKTQLFDASGTPVTISSVTNEVGSKGGAPGDNLADLQRKVPNSRKTAAARSINDIDFVNHAEKVPGVLRAFALTHKTSSLAPNKTDLLIVPAGLGTAPLTLLTAVQASIINNNPPSVLLRLTTSSATYATANIQATVKLVDGANEDDAKASVIQAYQDYFDPTINPNIKFAAQLLSEGQDAVISFHTLLCITEDDPNIHSIDGSTNGFLLNNQHANLVMSSTEFPALGTITLINSATGLTI